MTADDDRHGPGDESDDPTLSGAPQAGEYRDLDWATERVVEAPGGYLLATTLAVPPANAVFTPAELEARLDAIRARVEAERPDLLRDDTEPTDDPDRPDPDEQE